MLPLASAAVFCMLPRDFLVIINACVIIRLGGCTFALWYFQCSWLCTLFITLQNGVSFVNKTYASSEQERMFWPWILHIKSFNYMDICWTDHFLIDLKYLLYLLVPGSKHVPYEQGAISSQTCWFSSCHHVLGNFSLVSLFTWPASWELWVLGWWMSQSPSKRIFPLFSPLIALIKHVLRQGNSPSSEFCSDGYLHLFVCFLSKYQMISKFISVSFWS